MNRLPEDIRVDQLYPYGDYCQNKQDSVYHGLQTIRGYYD